MGCRVVPELRDERVPLQGGLDDASLDALAPSMNEPYSTQPCRVRRRYVLLHNRGNVSWVERVEVQLRLNRKTVDHVSRWSLVAGRWSLVASRRSLRDDRLVASGFSSLLKNAP